jgi:uncharacterized protein
MAQWDNLDTHGKVEDRRGTPMRMSRGIGLGGIALVLLVGYLQTGTIDVGTVLNVLSETQPPATQESNPAEFAGADAYETFAATVLGATTNAWGAYFTTLPTPYTPPHFVLFRGGTESGCGGAYAEVGPHYCPTDQTIYLDETFFDILRDQFGATGDVAQAYVIAHEVGHHVQTLLNIEQESIAQELQADCFAGLWAYSIKDKQVLEPGEIQEAIDAAAAVGDDNIQKKTTGTVHQETWTHGSSKERVAAFERGYTTGTFSACASSDAYSYPQ